VGQRFTAPCSRGLPKLKSLSWSRNSPSVTEPEGSLPYSLEPATCPYSESDESSPLPTSLRSIYTTVNKTYSLVCFNLYVFRKRGGRQMSLNWLAANILEFILLLISSWMQFWFVTVVPTYFNFATFSKVIILPCSLVTSHGHILTFLWFYLSINHAISLKYVFCVLLYDIYVFTRHISIDKNVTCPVQFNSPLSSCIILIVYCSENLE
jgi:hypothetical protein